MLLNVDLKCLFRTHLSDCNGWVFVYDLSGCWFKSSCSHLNFRFCACFEQGVPWHSGNYWVWIHSETCTGLDKYIQSEHICFRFDMKSNRFESNLVETEISMTFTWIWFYFKRSEFISGQLLFQCKIMYVFTENEISTWSEINFMFGYSYLVILESKTFQQLNIVKDLHELSGSFWYLPFLNILWSNCLYVRNLCHWYSINTN